ncbi:hypothetical protein EW145_g8135 [Phellinidium pouzarii]|uniref:Uncharacterized protein n=1 Tax=Phellinidium pouzarii TaxID=167371 RepID=A0A4S4KAX2_9AGAM|nr:hypothetical protein EW145_g8135 [Phellinidium pouzarii]
MPPRTLQPLSQTSSLEHALNRTLSSSPSSMRSESPTPIGKGRKRVYIEELTASGKLKKKKANNLSAYSALGRHIGRAYASWDSPGMILMAAIDRAVNEWQPPTEDKYNGREERYFNIVKDTLGLESRMFYDILNADNETFQRIVESIREGQCGARTAATSSVMDFINGAVKWGTSPNGEALKPPANKSERGFYHPTTAALLAPVEMGPVTESMLAALKRGMMTFEGEDGDEKPIDGTEFMNFYYLSPFDPVEPFEGLLKGPLLVQAYKAIFVAPSAASDYGGYCRSTSKGTAAKCNMFHVTPGSIANTVSQVYYALQTFSSYAHNMHREIEEVYDSIYAIFESDDEDMQEYIKELLQWWDNQIFPQRRHGLPKVSEGSKSSSLTRLSKHFKENVVPVAHK